MEENNRLETNENNSGSGSMLYGAGPQPPQAEAGGYSSVYDENSQGPAPVQLTKTTEAVSDLGGPAPVQLTKPTEPVSNPQGTMSVPPQPWPAPQGQYENGQPPVPPQPWPVQQGQPGNGQPPVPPQPWPAPQGQPGQNQMGFGPMQVPPPVQGAPAPKKKKNAAGLVVGILCAAAVVIMIVIGALAAKALLGGDSPEKQLAKGFANMTREMAAYQSSVAEDIGLEALTERKEKEPIHTNINLSFTDPNATGSVTSVNIKLDGVTDYQKKMAEYGVSAGVYGFSMNVANVVAADNTLYLSAPMVLGSDVYSMELTNLGRDFNKSAWSALADATLPADYSLTLFEEIDVDDAVGNRELQEIFRKRGNADSIKFEVINQKREFVFDGTTAEYGGVRVTIDKDMYNESVEALRDDILASDFYKESLKSYQIIYGDDFDDYKEELDRIVEQVFGVRFEQDIVYDFYLDNKGRIVNISTPEDIAVSGKDSDIESFAVDIDFAGKERTLDSIEGGVYVKVGDEILYMGISRTASITEDYYSENLTLSMQESNSDEEITFWYANKWGYGDQTFDLKMSFEVPDASIGISADGAFTDISKGERYTFQLDHGALTMDGEDMLLMTGSVTVEPTENEIEVPDHTINVFEMSESDIEDLFYDAFYGTLY